MDTDRIEGAATKLGGKVKDAVGGLTGDSKTQASGKMDQVGGEVQNAYGSVEDTVREQASTLGNQLDDFLKERPLMALLSAVGVGYVLARLTHRSHR